MEVSGNGNSGAWGGLGDMLTSAVQVAVIGAFIVFVMHGKEDLLAHIHPSDTRVQSMMSSCSPARLSVLLCFAFHFMDLRRGRHRQAAEPAAVGVGRHRQQLPAVVPPPTQPHRRWSAEDPEVTEVTAHETPAQRTCLPSPPAGRLPRWPDGPHHGRPPIYAGEGQREGGRADDIHVTGCGSCMRTELI